MASQTQPFNVSAELKALHHEKQNRDLPRLPPNTIIQRRPLNHAPIADLRTSGAKAPKVVYVSRRTPAIAAIKRVKKYLGGVEKRALDSAGAGLTKKGGQAPKAALEKANEALAEDKEEVLVKASGRAMAQALRVAEWFRSKEKDMLCDVVVRTGSVSAIDDLVQVEQEDDTVDKENEEDEPDGAGREYNEVVDLQCGDTTLELLGGADVTGLGSGIQPQSAVDGNPEMQKDDTQIDSDGVSGKKSRRARKKRKRPVYEVDEVPEARIRWVKTVEVTISLKG